MEVVVILILGTFVVLGSIEVFVLRRPCPKCAKRFSTKATRCPSCGEDVPAPEGGRWT